MLRSITLPRLSVLLVLGVLSCGQKSNDPAASASVAPSALGSAAAPALPPATFQVALLNDTLDPLATDPVTPKPLPEGASVFSEAVPLGMKRVEIPKALVKELCAVEGTCVEENGAHFIEQPDVVERHYLRFVKLDGEALDVTAARAKKFLATAAPGDAGTFRLARAYEESETPGKDGDVIGFRTFLLQPEPVLSPKHVASAAVEEARGAIVVMIQLTPEGTASLEAATQKNIARRLAVVVGDEVLMSPAIQGVIKGGKLPLGIGKVEDAATAKPEAEAVLATILRAKG